MGINGSSKIRARVISCDVGFAEKVGNCGTAPGAGVSNGGFTGPPGSGGPWAGTRETQITWKSDAKIARINARELALGSLGAFILQALRRFTGAGSSDNKGIGDSTSLVRFTEMPDPFD